MKQNLVKIKPFSKREIQRRRAALRRVILQVRADPVLKADIKKFIEISQSPHA